MASDAGDGRRHDGEDGGLWLLPPTRQTIVRLLRRHGELAAEQLADELELTPSALRQQLAVLATEGYVVHRSEADGPGRPKHRYRLTEFGDALFPRRYSELTTDLLELVDSADPALVEDLFRRRVARRLARLAVTPDDAFADRVAALAALLDREGYECEAVPLDDGSEGWRITEWNCAIVDVASRFPHPCSAELDFVAAALPDAEVIRVQHLVAGGSRCAYEVRPRLPRRR